MAIDYTQASKDILVQKVNQENGIALTSAQVDFGVPAVKPGVTDPTAPGVLNTVVTMTGRPNTGFSGSVQISYRRRWLKNLESRSVTTFSVNDATLISHLLPAINLEYGMGLTLDDIVDGPLPTFSGNTPNATLPFTLVAKPTSLMYIGQASLTVRRADISLASLITDITLEALPADDV